ncbi:MAG: DUF2852 domain-containing protein [Granulosicoccus sp.]
MSSATKSRVCPSPMGPTQRWSGTNIAVMVLGFVMFWPLGLVILGWIMVGRDVRDLPGAIKNLWAQFFGGSTVDCRFSGSDNIVFNEYQQTQYDRISEIKNEIRERARRFKEFSMDAKRRADREEFDRFMSSAPDGRGGTV